MAGTGAALKAGGPSNLLRKSVPPPPLARRLRCAAAALTAAPVPADDMLFPRSGTKLSKEHAAMDITTLQAAAHDPLPALIASLATDMACGIDAASAERIVAGEVADFHWDARIDARLLGIAEPLDEEDGEHEVWLVLGYLAGCWFVARIGLDREGKPAFLSGRQRLESAWDAYEAFEQPR
ncbi:hypothetical protein [Sphingomonas crusticola]|uniref:hypothetical protein n=1 Tax=Sphingomonas crusticola TaxID=1697973 RepID=UPI000E23434B|nr:hypothetical protein [Sphingomonas crusticola]